MHSSSMALPACCEKQTASTVTLPETKVQIKNPKHKTSKQKWGEKKKIFQFTGKANIVLLASYEELMWLPYPTRSFQDMQFWPPMDATVIPLGLTGCMEILEML